MMDRKVRCMTLIKLKAADMLLVEDNRTVYIGDYNNGLLILRFLREHEKKNKIKFDISVLPVNHSTYMLTKFTVKKELRSALELIKSNFPENQRLNLMGDEAPQRVTMRAC